MARNYSEQKDIRCRVIHELSKDTNEKYKTIRRLAVIAWVIDGREATPQIAVQDLYLDDSGNEKNGKTKGMNPSNFWTLLENLDIVSPLMNVPHDKLEEVLVKILQKIRGEAPAEEPI